MGERRYQNFIIAVLLLVICLLNYQQQKSKGKPGGSQVFFGLAVLFTVLSVLRLLNPSCDWYNVFG
jgi:hypothetical protein